MIDPISPLAATITNARRYFGKKRSTKVIVQDKTISLVYHDTTVAKLEIDGYGRGNVTINTGGYPSNTTKRRINDFCRLFGIPLSIYQDGRDCKTGEVTRQISLKSPVEG